MASILASVPRIFTARPADAHSSRPLSFRGHFEVGEIMAVTAPAQGGESNQATEEATQRKPSRRRLLIIIGMLAIIAGLVWGLRWWTVGRFIESTDDAYLQADSVTIAPKVAGYVTEVLVADNQAVAAGAPLARLDTRQYQ